MGYNAGPATAQSSQSVFVNNLMQHHRHGAEVLRTLQLAAPVVLGQLAIFSMNFVDTVMAGRLPQRDIALAGLGIGGAIWSGLMMFTIGCLMAVQPSVAHLDGAGLRHEAATLTRRMALGALSYIHAEMRNRTLTVQAFHTFPDDYAIVKSQSVFELP